MITRRMPTLVGRDLEIYIITVLVCILALKENGQKFSGYDYGSGSHFSGSISLKTVQLFDYGTNQYFTYSV